MRTMEMMLWQSAFISQVKNTLKQRLTDSFLRLTSLCDFISLEGLKEELEKLKVQNVIASILGKKSELNDYARDVGVKLQQVEVESIKDYMKESDNLISLHTQIRDCDSILEEMEGLLGGFQANLGVISSELKGLQEQSMSMGHKLKNRKIAESDLSRFLENIVVPPKMIDIIANSEDHIQAKLVWSQALHVAVSNISDK
ncbi:hypothetical protein KP509_20G015700 [Ceratopteris richardii]|uniref:Vps52 coiled-coil domain-containing protein n=1 Tax=Ceratopteris richardii TaxID=49495 RepID=A0A8T2SGN1_CERRI|nr:hypothetical protein KP509_20G015700 [Ceratopteris richardii]